MKVDKDKRLIFAKDRNKNYIFMGLYEFFSFEEYDDYSNQKIYIKISSTYPEEK